MHVLSGVARDTGINYSYLLFPRRVFRNQPIAYKRITRPQSSVLIIKERKKLPNEPLIPIINLLR